MIVVPKILEIKFNIPIMIPYDTCWHCINSTIKIRESPPLLDNYTLRSSLKCMVYKKYIVSDHYDCEDSIRMSFLTTYLSVDCELVSILGIRI